MLTETSLRIQLSQSSLVLGSLPLVFVSKLRTSVCLDMEFEGNSSRLLKICVGGRVDRS